jgi:ribosome maturation factor RimP
MLDKLKEWIEPAVKELDCSVYEIEWDKSMTPPVLRISVENLKGPTDLDTCAKCSDVISEILDEKDAISSEYMLEVCSPGAERELKNDEQLERAAGSYVLCKLINPKDGHDSVMGTLEKVGPETIVISHFVKGRPKKTEIERSNIAVITTAVKL